MSVQFLSGKVLESPRQAIFVLRITNALLEPWEVDDLAERVREKLAHKGEINADVVVLQGRQQGTLRFFGLPNSVRRVRDAMFHASISWTPFFLDTF